MKDILFNALIFGLLTLGVIGIIAGATGCSTSTLVKDCAKVEEQDYFKCKTLKPWE